MKHTLTVLNTAAPTDAQKAESAALRLAAQVLWRQSDYRSAAVCRASAERLDALFSPKTTTYSLNDIGVMVVDDCACVCALFVSHVAAEAYIERFDASGSRGLKAIAIREA